MYAIRGYYDELYFDAQDKLFEALASPAGQDLMVALSEWAEARIIRITSYNVCYTKLLRDTYRAPVGC